MLANPAPARAVRARVRCPQPTPHSLGTAAAAPIPSATSCWRRRSGWRRGPGWGRRSTAVQGAHAFRANLEACRAAGRCEARARRSPSRLARSGPRRGPLQRRSRTSRRGTLPADRVLRVRRRTSPARPSTPGPRAPMRCRSRVAVSRCGHLLGTRCCTRRPRSSERMGGLSIVISMGSGRIRPACPVPLCRDADHDLPWDVEAVKLVGTPGAEDGQPPRVERLERRHVLVQPVRYIVH